MPPQTTLILNDIPDRCLLGIDIQFFTPTPNFQGTKLIPAGLHTLHWAPPVSFTHSDISISRNQEIDPNKEDELGEADDLPSNQTADEDLGSMNLRMATFFEATEGAVISFRWDDAVEEFVRTPAFYTGRFTN